MVNNFVNSQQINIVFSCDIGKSAVIVHHIGYIKPWDLKSKSPYRDLYWKILVVHGTVYERLNSVIMALANKFYCLRKKIISIKFNIRVEI